MTESIVWVGSAVILGWASAGLVWLLFRNDIPRWALPIVGLPIVLIIGQLFLSFAKNWHLPGF